MRPGPKVHRKRHKKNARFVKRAFGRMNSVGSVFEYFGVLVF